MNKHYIRETTELYCLMVHHYLFYINHNHKLSGQHEADIYIYTHTIHTKRLTLGAQSADKVTINIAKTAMKDEGHTGQTFTQSCMCLLTWLVWL